jgi:hypothetical protein
MSDDQRVYSDDEFALILRTAAELANRFEKPGRSSNGLTLTEMKSAAAQAGLDPALVERAARLLVTRATASPLEQLIGGPFRHEHDAHFSIKLDEHNAARLLSAVRINTDFHSSDPGHSSALGMTWNASGDGDVLSVAARPGAHGTSVSVVIDRRGTFVLTGVISSLAMFFAVLFAVFALGPEAPWLGYAGLVAGIGGVLAVARNFWASSTRKDRERIGVVMDAIGQTLSQPEPDLRFHCRRGRRCGSNASCECSRRREANKVVNLTVPFGARRLRPGR